MLSSRQNLSTIVETEFILPRFVLVGDFYQNLGFPATAETYQDFSVAHAAMAMFAEHDPKRPPHDAVKTDVRRKRAVTAPRFSGEQRKSAR